MHILLSILLFFITFQNVLICKSDGAYVYHNRLCQGLKNCEHQINEISMDAAIKKGRKACGYCYAKSSAPSNAVSLLTECYR